ncbi:MAG: ribbon-helix-helix domain-containing protein [Symbiobacteriia bacterium]
MLQDDITEVVLVGRLIRKQIYITEAQNDALKRIASRRSRTEAEIIREALEHYLRTEEGLRRDPLLDIIGVASGGPKDGSERHDRDI